MIRNELFHGIKLSIFTEAEFDNNIDYLLKSNESEPNIFYGYSVGILQLIKEHEGFCEMVNKSDILVTDGEIFAKICRVFKFKLKDTFSIPRMTIRILDRANLTPNSSVYLLGSTPEDNAKAIKNLKVKYPNISFTGHDGFYDINEEKSIIREINKINPTILLLGLPSPRKEIFAINYKNSINCRIIVPCGGMIGVFAGKETLTPPFLKKIGLAWLFRLYQHPISKLHYMKNSFVVLFILTWNLLKAAYSKKEINIPEVFKVHYKKSQKQ